MLVKQKWPYPVYKDSHLWRNLHGRNYMQSSTKWQNWWEIKIANPIYDNKNFAEDSLKIHPKSCNDNSYIPEKSVDTVSNNSKNQNFNYGNYDHISSDKCFTDEHINSDDPNKTASENEITMNNIKHHLLDRIISVENMNVWSCSGKVNHQVTSSGFRVQIHKLREKILRSIYEISFSCNEIWNKLFLV